MLNFAEVMQRAAETDQQIASLKSGQKASIVDFINRLMAAYEVTISDLSAGQPSEGAPRRKPHRSPTPKYQDDKGRQWAGRGLPPLWVKEALASGKTLEDLLIKKSDA